MSAAEDRAEIAELLARYAIACDRKAFDAVGECFTEDGQATYSGVRLPQGRAAIVAHLQPLSDIPMTQHVVGSISIELDGDSATATSYTTVHVVRPTADGHEVVHRGLSYDDRLVRTSDGWRFEERFHQVLWSTSDPTTWPVPPFSAT
jgi:uncharacterized protein (TIGR02246 family)